MEICDLLKQTRIDLGLTQQGMVGEVMSVAQYSRIESGSSGSRLRICWSFWKAIITI